MARPIRILSLDNEQTQELETIVRSPKSPQRQVRRARIILARAGGMSQQQAADLIGINRPVVAKWEGRFIKDGIPGLAEARRSGRKPAIPARVRSQIITEATSPPAGRTQWSSRTMAKAKGVSPDTVQRLWRANGIKPHIKRTFKISNDKDFEAKFWDVVGLYLDPPERSLVLCCDEKSQCQALERTQPGLPLGPHRVRTGTHDYIRHGTITLFAALNYLDGKIIRQTAERHTHEEWLVFIKHLEKETPAGLTLHLVVDNYATHKHPKVKSWIKWINQRHRKQHGVERMVIHFTPTSSSWMNLVERFFRDLTVDCVRDGSFASVDELVESIEAYLAQRDLEPKRYVWKAEGQEILRKIQRAKDALNQECEKSNYE
jgi:transposase